MNISYEKALCDHCDNTKVYEEIRKLTSELRKQLKLKHENYTELFEDENIIKERNKCKDTFKKMCVVIENSEGGIYLCKEHFKKLLEEFPE